MPGSISLIFALCLFAKTLDSDEERIRCAVRKSLKKKLSPKAGLRIYGRVAAESCEKVSVTIKQTKNNSVTIFFIKLFEWRPEGV